MNKKNIEGSALKKKSNKDHKIIDLSINPTLRDRFEEKFIPVTEAGCWIWEATLTRGNYGNIGVRYKTPSGSEVWKMTRASRVSYVLYNGSIPKGQLVCHSCDNPLCVNPNHLTAGTYKDNVQQMIKRGRDNLRGFSSHLTEDDVIGIRKDYHSGEMTNKLIGEKYGASVAAVSLIARGLRRKEVLGGLL